MNLSIEIAADLEARLLEEAAKHGMDPGQFVVNSIRDKLQVEQSAPRLTAEESRLLEKLNLGLSQEEWSRYYELVAQRQRGEVSENDLAELSVLSTRIEELNVQRMESLAELARLRGTTLPHLMDQVGIECPRVM